jgi:hypothetical protein
VTKIIMLLAATGLLVPASIRNEPTQDDKKKEPAAPTLTIKFVDEEAKKKQMAATVQATVTGLDIVDPATANETAKAGQGHLHYQVDDGPVIATTATKLSFHMLKPGKHTFKVSLAGNDHKDLGVEQTLTVDIAGM